MPKNSRPAAFAASASPVAVEVAVATIVVVGSLDARGVVENEVVGALVIVEEVVVEIEIGAATDVLVEVLWLVEVL